MYSSEEQDKLARYALGEAQAGILSDYTIHEHGDIQVSLVVEVRLSADQVKEALSE